MAWETRTHWLWGFLRPGFWYLLLAILGSAGMLTGDRSFVIVGLLLLLVAGIGVWVLWNQWHSFSISLDKQTVRERRGFAMTSDRHIYFGMIGSILYRQTPIGRLLDYGSLSITAMGGPFEWENLGQFRTLRRIIDSQGEWMPQSHNLWQVALRGQLRWVRSFLSRLWMRFLAWWNRRPHRLSALSFARSETSSYDRFLNFVENALFPRNIWHFDAAGDLFESRANEYSVSEVMIFWRVLRIRRILVLNRQGRPFLHPRILSMQDIIRRIHREWFRRYSRQYGVRENL
jgi:hypothetical protein